ncbi:beta-4C adrenergic receptor-like [Asterias amurensis]|uniref:beta-4C adrenergic receptor-like n=1 Tax=Asterias amurensis TaxID=7602 RepID=UPI003AB2F53E
MNSTSETPPSNTAVVVLRTIFIASNGLAIVIANTLNIVVVGRARIGSEPARVFIVSLALADILVGALAFTSTLPSGYDGFPFSDALCRITGSVFAVGLLLSVFFLVNISVDRFVAITIPLRYEALITRKRAFITVCVAWVAISGISLVTTLLTDVMKYNRATFFCEPSFEDPSFPLSLFIVIMWWIMNGSLIMMMINGHLFRVAHRHSKIIASQGLAAVVESNKRQRQQRWSRVARTDMKALRMCLAVTLAFNCAWIPTLCLDFYKFIRKENAAPAVEFAVTWLSLSNSWWNFLIYSCLNKQFRRAAKQVGERLLAKCRRGKTRRQTVEQTSKVSTSSKLKRAGNDI